MHAVDGNRVAGRGFAASWSTSKHIAFSPFASPRAHALTICAVEHQIHCTKSIQHGEQDTAPSLATTPSFLWRDMGSLVRRNFHLLSLACSDD